MTTSFAPKQWSNPCFNRRCGFIYAELKKLHHKCSSQLDKNAMLPSSENEGHIALQMSVGSPSATTES